MSEAKGTLVLLVEDDGRFVRPVEDALRTVAPKLTLKVFRHLAEFDTWLAMPTESRQPGESPSDVRLVLGPAEALRTTSEAAAWVTKIATAGVPSTSNVLLTTFETPDRALSKWIPSGAFNLLSKPYDSLLLQQHLRIALGENAPSSGETVHSMKTDSLIEVLKSVPMIALSEIGFVTRSERELPIGRVTKFYGKVFSWRDAFSVYARGLDQTRDPVSGDWTVKLTWFGTGRDQLLQMRARYPRNRDLNIDWRGKTDGTPVRLLVINDPSPPGSELSATLTRNFPGVDVRPSAGIPPAGANLPLPITAILVNRDNIEALNADPRFKDIPRIVMTEKSLKDEDFRNLSSKAMDVVAVPPERVSFLKKMSVLFPALVPLEETQIRSFDWQETLDVGQPVEIVEMSEAGLVERYERPLPPGTFRRFVLWQPFETGLPVLTARCYLSKPDPARAGSHLNHFVFFGMADREIKHVRVWMRDNYIQSKQKN